MLCLIRGDAIILYFCLVLHVLNSESSLREACCSLLSICQALSLSFSPTSTPPSRLSDSLLLPFSLSAPSHIYSSFLHWVDDSLVFESCAFCSMICSVVSLLLPGLSLSLPPPSPPRKPTDFNVRVCVICPYFQPYNAFNIDYLLTRTLLLFLTHINTPSLCPKPLCLSPPNYMLPPHPSSTAGLPGTGPLHTWGDRGLACQPPGEISRVSVTSDLPQNVHQTLVCDIKAMSKNSSHFQYVH